MMVDKKQQPWQGTSAIKLEPLSSATCPSSAVMANTALTCLAGELSKHLSKIKAHRQVCKQRTLPVAAQPHHVLQVFLEVCTLLRSHNTHAACTPSKLRC
eukprot:TRINITY_DN7425_c0_g1_i1.p3 TRINITY_DN7425_c0_g1~~TRINITY_DN7425_c0_g1_i1.p3  ORF type:complete len:100 (-),score=5.39 TRINITY_DN7425_c0_g1_i1:496-795(-)